ncbi:MAG: hypothetical protein GF320_15925 [Armatimonadia bacterium]|nr:hypothetical protein [Armatimonadia bacterium]
MSVDPPPVEPRPALPRAQLVVLAALFALACAFSLGRYLHQEGHRDPPMELESAPADLTYPLDEYRARSMR